MLVVQRSWTIPHLPPFSVLSQISAGLFGKNVFFAFPKLFYPPTSSFPTILPRPVCAPDIVRLGRVSASLCCCFRWGGQHGACPASNADGSSQRCLLLFQMWRAARCLSCLQRGRQLTALSAAVSDVEGSTVPVLPPMRTAAHSVVCCCFRWGGQHGACPASNTADSSQRRRPARGGASRPSGSMSLW